MRQIDSLPGNVEDARQLERQGARMKFLFFWGHQPQRDGSIGAGCLSQWWPAAFTVDNATYPTAEHFMMHRKARLFGDEQIAARILAAPHPGAAKTLGRQVGGFDDAVWNAHRYDIVVAGNTEKFGQHPELCDYLVGSRGRVLVEASPLDRVWGIGLAEDDERANRPSQWPGLNLLGFALMDVRAALPSR
jgi:ribA/ribD-fused uncharacterized protein